MTDSAVDRVVMAQRVIAKLRKLAADSMQQADQIRYNEAADTHQKALDSLKRNA